MAEQNNLIAELEEALSSGSADRRVNTLRRVTDLFVFGLGHFSGEHIAVFDDVFNHLISDIELSARTVLAGRLAKLPNAPLKVIRKLAFDDAIEVAGPVLSHSGVLDNVTLVENANTKSQAHLLAISQRSALAETVTDVLVERGNREVALSAVKNEGAKFSEVGYVRLLKRSVGDDELAKSVGSRREIPRHHFLNLLTKASKAVRLELEAANPHIADEIREVVAQVAAAIQANAAAASWNFVRARALVETMRSGGRLTETELENFARNKKFEETAAALAVLCNLPIDVIERAIAQDRSETILIVAKAVGLSWAAAKAVLLLRAGDRGMSTQALDQCKKVFDQLNRKTAQEVVEFQRRRQETGSKAR